MRRLDAQQVADLLLEIGRRSSLEGGNPYKARAYIRAAESLRALVVPLGAVIRRSQLRALPGIGDAIARRILELREKGTDESLERLRAKYPPSLLELMDIPRLKPGAVTRLHKELGIANLKAAEAAARAGRLRKVKGLGLAVERQILEGAPLARGAQGRMRANRAAELLQAAAEALRSQGLENITVAGELRRGCEIVSNLRLVGTAPDVTAHTRLGAVGVELVPPDKLGSALLFATGSDAHLAQLEDLAKKKGLILTRDGIGKPGGPLRGRTEEELYRRLGLSFIPPELREGNDEVGLARAGKLPHLVAQHDLKGLLHVHTDFSDGVHTLREMAEATRARGYRYLGITDHSQSAHYAGGLSIDAILRQHELIDALNDEFGQSFRILKGIESDIRADGSLDYAQDVLATFDFVVASVHSGFRGAKMEQTARIIKAVSNPFSTILGHVTGRLLLRRPGYDVDLEAILSACAEYDVAVEINCNPHRLELDWRWHRRAIELGCSLCINPDAHSVRELDLVQWGIAIARKGGVERQSVLNAKSPAQLIKHLQRRRPSAERRAQTRTPTATSP
jgi:DNA polymerase (family 10)